MQVEEELAKFAPHRETVLAIGVFDGVHLGHRHLIEYLKRQALVRDHLAGIITFANHPQEIVSPQAPVSYLSSLEEKLNLLRQLDVGLIVPLSFNQELARLSARQFTELLQKHLKMRGIVVGPDFALGKGREGDVFALRSLGKEMGFTTDVVAPKIIEGEIASSTNVRRALAEGDINKVSMLLGRPYSLKGPVVHGYERGTSLGFPTANLEVKSNRALPADGVYVTRAYLGNDSYPSVTNIGTRPTFGQGDRTIEVFLLDFKGGIYGEELRIDIVEHLREEKRFADPAELMAQIGKDVERAREIFQEGVK